MTYKQIAEMVAEIGVPYAYYQFTKDTAVAPPFVCFFYPNDSDLYADDENYQKITHLTIEVYTDAKDFALEKTVEDVLRSHGFTWTRSESRLGSERMFEVIYETDVVITEETNNG